MRVVGIVAPFSPRGIGTQEKFVLSSPKGGKQARESQTKFRGVTVWGLCRRVLWVPDPQGQYSGIIRFIEKLGYKTSGVAMWLNIVLNDTWVAYCELWIFLPLCPTGVGTRGKFILSRNLWYKTRGGGRHVA